MPIAPKLKLTADQWKALLKRIVEREGSLTSKESIDEIMKYHPPKEGEYGSLIDLERPHTVGLGGEPVYKRTVAPLEETRKLYSEDPTRYKIPSQGTGEVDIATPLKGERGTENIDPFELVNPQNFEERVAYERMKFKRPVSSQIESSIKGLTSTEETIPGTKGPLKTEKASIVPLVQEADSAYKALGGKRGMGGQLWERIYNTSKFKRHYKDSKSYFIQLYTRWKADPQSLGRDYVREKNLFETTSKILGEEAPGGMEQTKAKLSQKFRGGLGSLVPGAIFNQILQGGGLDGLTTGQFGAEQ